MNDSGCDLQKIYADYYPKILRYLMRLVGEDDAEDLAQEVFIKVGLALPRFRRESSLSTWLYRIATNAATDRLRSPSFQRTTPLSACAGPGRDEIGDLPESALYLQENPVAVEQLVVSQEMSACIQRYLGQLPESYRTVLVLSDMEGLSDRQVAEVLGITLEAAKIRLHRARLRLQENFLDHCEYYWVSELSWPAF